MFSPRTETRTYPPGVDGNSESSFRSAFKSRYFIRLYIVRPAGKGLVFEKSDELPDGNVYKRNAPLTVTSIKIKSKEPKTAAATNIRAHFNEKSFYVF